MAKNKHNSGDYRPVITGNTVKFPSIPHDEEYEDYIAAYLLAAGYHVERKLIKREEKVDVLEIDIVSTNYTKGGRHVFEIKSGGWGITDLHKMYGWKNLYCPLHSALVFLKNLDSGEQAAQMVASKYEIDLIDGSDASLKMLALRYPAINGKYVNGLITLNRLAFLVERAIEKEIGRHKKANPDKTSYSALSDFYREVRNYSFFQPSPITRASHLIEVFRKNRNFTARLSNMTGDGTLPGDIDLKIPRAIFSRLFFTCQNPDVLYGSLLAELMCRMTVLKSVVDHLLLNDAGSADGGKYSFIQHFEEAVVDNGLGGGLYELSRHPSLDCYPHFWQIFIYVFGGFIVEEYEEEEYSALSEMTGIPVGEIPHALGAFDILFAHSESWFITDSNSGIRMMKLFPVPFRGVGVLLRSKLFCEPQGLTITQKYKNWYALNDLRKWASLSFKYIETIVPRIPAAP